MLKIFLITQEHLSFVRYSVVVVGAANTFMHTICFCKTVDLWTSHGFQNVFPKWPKCCLEPLSEKLGKN